MASRDPSPFSRLFPVHEFRQKDSLLAILWSTLNTFLLGALLVNIYLAVDLLQHHGRLVLTQQEGETLSKEYARQLGLPAVAGETAGAGGSTAPAALAPGQPAPGQPAPVAAPAPAATAVPKPQALRTPRSFVDAGILPTAWQDRHRLWGPWVGGLYRAIPTLRHNIDALITLVISGAVLCLLRSLIASRVHRLHLRRSMEISARLRRLIHRQALRLGPSDIEGKELGSTRELFVTTVDQLSKALYAWMETWSRDPLQLLLLVTIAFLPDPMLTLQCLFPLVACWFLAQREQLRREEVDQLHAVQAEKDIRLLAEPLEKTRLIRGSGMEEFEHALFERHLQRTTEHVFTAIEHRRWARFGVRVFIGLCVGIMLLFIGGNVLRDPPDISNAMATVMLATLALSWYPLRNLARLPEVWHRANRLAQRVQSYVNRIPEVGQAVGAKFLQPLSRLLEFDNVTYQTPDKRRLLNGVTFKLAAGRQWALVSTDPQEAQAVAHLLPRFIEPQSGKILIDGEDLAWVTLESLRAESLLVTCSAAVLSGTVRDNIGGGQPHSSLQEVTDAAKLSHAHNFIVKLPQGFETQIGEQGEELDAGQCLRLGLARAALRKPALLIIEEPDGPLDDDTRSLVDDAYTRLAPGRTIIYLPRRISTIRRADSIIFLHQGQVLAIGSQETLINTCPLYRHWEYVNFNEFRHEYNPTQRAASSR